MMYSWQAHLEDGLPLDVEVARYLVHDSLVDPAWEHYHAAGACPGWVEGQTQGRAS